MIKYHLAEACQNTFVLFDCLNQACLDEPFLKRAHQCLVKENRDDALILCDGAHREEGFCARYLVLGHDQALGEFCGNGARVCAAYLFGQYPHLDTIHLITPHGKHLLTKHIKAMYSVTLSPARFKWNHTFIKDASLFSSLWPHLVYVEMLEPHLIVRQKMSDAELLSLGQEINQHKEIFPLGINVNAWHVLEDGVLEVKTYERGVQRLTRSCGTGGMACAAFYKKLGPVKVATPGGLLEIIIHKNTIELKGPAICHE